MAKVFLTGCAGFIGSHVAEQLLAAGHQVTGIDNFDLFYSRKIKEENMSGFIHHKSFQFIEGDICNPSAFPASKFDVVLHLAAKAGVRPSIEQPRIYLDVNVNGTQNLLEWMREQSMHKLVFASSSSVYGNNEKTPFSETDNVDAPISPYAATKKSAELLCHTYHHLHDINILCLRFFTVYGPRQRPDLAIYKFNKLIADGKVIQMFGDGSTARDYTFVSDTVVGVIKAMEYVMKHENVFEIINLGNNQPVTLKKLIDEISHIQNVKPMIEQLPMQAGDVDITFADISKAEKILDYHPSVKIEEGLKKFFQWFKEQREKHLV